MTKIHKVKNKAKYQILYDQLRSDITAGSYKVGQAIPSQQHLTQLYGVSLSTVRQALQLLQNDKLIRLEHGRGAYVQKPDNEYDRQIYRRKTSIGMAICEPMPSEPAYMMMLRGATSVLQEVGKDLTFAMFRLEEIEKSSVLTDFAKDLDGLIITGHISSSLITSLDGHINKIVIAGYPLEKIDGNFFSYVTCDAESAGYMAAQLLLTHGHKRVGLIGSAENLYHQTIQAGFRHACEDAQISPPDFFLSNKSSKDEIIAKEIADRNDLSALVVVNDEKSCRFISLLESYGCSVPADKSIVSIGGLPRNTLPRPGLARIGTNLEAIGTESAKILLQNNYYITNKMLPVQIECGDTLARI